MQKIISCFFIVTIYMGTDAIETDISAIETTQQVNEIIFGPVAKPEDPKKQQQAMRLLQKKAQEKKKAQDKQDDIMINMMEKQIINKAQSYLKKIFFRNIKWILIILSITILMILLSLGHNYIKFSQFKQWQLIKD
jgi:hypothetical protein